VQYAVEDKRCLVLLPIGVTRRQEGPTFLALYQHILLPALHATGFPLHIRRQLWLQEPHLVVAELTTQHSGVLHDLSLRNFLASRTVLLSQYAEDILPCFVTYRQIIYTLSEGGIARLHQELRHHVSEILKPLGPCTAIIPQTQSTG
jgi:hypothetical protein